MPHPIKTWFTKEEANLSNDVLANMVYEGICRGTDEHYNYGLSPLCILKIERLFKESNANGRLTLHPAKAFDTWLYKYLSGLNVEPFETIRKLKWSRSPIIRAVAKKVSKERLMDDPGYRLALWALAVSALSLAVAIWSVWKSSPHN